MFFLAKIIPRWLIAFFDLGIQLFSLALAYLIRFDLKADKSLILEEWEILSKSIIFYIGVKFCVFYYFKIHKSLIRHTSVIDVRRIFLATFISSIIFLILGIIRYKFFDNYFLFPSSVLIMEFLISFILLLTYRFAIKALNNESSNYQGVENILIYGAGKSGLLTKKTLENDTKINYNIVGFLDDNKKLHRKIIEGKTIFAPEIIEQVFKQHEVTKVIISIQNPAKSYKKHVINSCINSGIEVLQVPSSKSWINGEFSTKQISKLNIEDLLGRNPIQLNSEKIKHELGNKIVLVTGASGSIGSGLVKEIASYGPEKLILLDQAESPMYDLENDLRTEFPDLNFEFVIGDIRNRDRLRNLFQSYKPKYVFHAAAYKHVPLMENNPSEALLTNIKGTINLVDLAKEFEVVKFVMISTDKAVNPTNVMGASKRVAEIYAQLNNTASTKIITTRFGNVLGSNGSVIPLFKKQIEQGGPITLTDERITRFFMTIPEACQLVLEAASMGEGGEIFVFDMGESVKIIDLAKKMIQLSGLELGKDIEIKIVGLRPGEKLYEELLSDEENTLPTHHPQILIAKTRKIEEAMLHEILNLVALFEAQNNIEIVTKMKKIVPEYKSNNSEYSILDL